MSINLGAMPAINPAGAQAAGTQAVSTQVPAFAGYAAGDTISTEVTGIKDDNMVTMKTPEGAEITAKFPEGVAVNTGDTVDVLLVSKGNNSVNLRPIAINGQSIQMESSELQSYLMDNGIAPSKLNEGAAQVLMNYNISPTPKNVSNLVQVATTLPEIPTAVAVTMAQNEIPPTRANADALQQLATQPAALGQDISSLSGMVENGADGQVFSQIFPQVVSQSATPEQMQQLDSRGLQQLASNLGSQIQDQGLENMTPRQIQTAIHQFTQQLPVSQEQRAAIEQVLTQAFTQTSEALQTEGQPQAAPAAQPQAAEQPAQAMPQEATPQPAAQQTPVQTASETQAAPQQVQTPAEQPAAAAPQAQTAETPAQPTQPAQTQTVPQDTGTQQQVQAQPQPAQTQAPAAAPQPQQAPAQPQTAQNQQPAVQTQTAPPAPEVPQNQAASQPVQTARPEAAQQPAAEAPRTEGAPARAPEQTAPAEQRTETAPVRAEREPDQPVRTAETLVQENPVRQEANKIMSNLGKMVVKVRDGAVQEDAKALQDGVRDQQHLSNLTKEGVTRLFGSASAAAQKANEMANQVRVGSQLDQFYYAQVPFQTPQMDGTADLYVFQRQGQKAERERTHITVLIGLDTPHMGRVESVLRSRDERLSVEFRVSSKRVQSFFEDAIGAFRTEMREIGFPLESVTVSQIGEKVTPVNALRVMEPKQEIRLRGLDIEA